jgi:gliding motility-associatede transport system auxiliary component
MAIEDNEPGGGRQIPALACTVPYLAGMSLIYVGERMVGSPLSARLLLDGLGAACLLWAVLARIVNWVRSHGERRSVEAMILASYLGGVLAVAMYAAQVDAVRKEAFPWIEGARVAARYEGVLQVLWPIVWLSSVLPLLFMEISYASMARAPRIERRRVAFSAGSGLVIAWLASSLALINYVGDARNHKWDLSFQRTSSPSEDARKLVSGLNEPFEVFLFFPDANEVLEELSGYFEELAGLSSLLQVRVYDHVLEPKRAEELGVRQNGSLVYRYGGKKEVVHIGEEMAEAESKLAKLDAEFQDKFLRLVAEKRTAYFITGHGERPYEWEGQEEPRAPVQGLKKILREQNFEVKPLGLGQGLGAEVPADASLLLVIDPAENFLPEELTSIRRYLEGGGRMWVALDPENSCNLFGLLEDYGVRFHPTLLANDQYFMRVYYSKADRNNLFTNRTSSHASVNTLTQNASRLAVVLLGSGYLEKLEKKSGAGRVLMTLRSMPNTWADENRNLEFDPPGEEKKTYDLAAAVTADVEKIGAERAGNDTGVSADQKPGDSGKKQMRMLVVADADALSDKVIGNLGNYFLFADGLKWLFEGEKLLSTAGTEEDVRIIHTKKEDVVWFYTTIFGVPLVVLGVGVVYNRFRLRQTRRGRKG